MDLSRLACSASIDILKAGKRRLFLSARLVAITLAVAFCFQAGAWAENRTAPEYQVKAAFLLNFIKFIEWPDSAEKKGVTLCVIGKDPFGSLLDQLAASQTPPPSIARLSRTDDMKRCNLAFISQSESDVYAKILASFANSSIVTVSDIPGFVDNQGVIGLVIEEERVRFEIGLAAAKNAKIVISSKLLSLAKNAK